MSCCGRKPVKRRGSMKMRKIGGFKLKVQKTYLKSFLMCRPKHYYVPWLDEQLVVQQWDDLKDRISEYDGETLFVSSKPDQTRMTFSADAGLTFKDQNIAVLSNFRNDDRKYEEQYFLEWFLERGYAVKTLESYFESGDVARFNNVMIGGYGPRTDLLAYAEISNTVMTPAIITVQMANPAFYHLNQAFCPLDGTEYLIYPGAFNEAGLAAIRQLGGSEITVSSGEAVKMACSSVCVGRTIMMPSGCPQIKADLEQRSYKVVEIDVSEFLKAGEGCKALALEL